MRKVSEVLVSALKRFGPNGEHWVQHTLFNGKHVEQADQFCSIGAIAKDVHKNKEPLFTADLKEIAKFFPDEDGTGHAIIRTNDNAASFSEVKDMFCHAIKKAWRLGCNLGGEVQVIRLDDKEEFVGNENVYPYHTLMTKEEALALERNEMETEASDSAWNL